MIAPSGARATAGRKAGGCLFSGAECNACQKFHPIQRKRVWGSGRFAVL